MKAPVQPAAATVTHRGVKVLIYGPLKDRKQPVFLLSYHVGSQRKKATVKGTLDDAKRAAKKKAEATAAGDLVDDLQLTPLERRVFVTAKAAAHSTGQAVDVIVRDAVAAFKILGPGVSLSDAAKFYATQHCAALPSATPADVAEELYEWMTGKRRKSEGIRTLKSCIKAFARDFSMPIASITTQAIDKWLSGHLTHSPRTQVNYLRAVKRLFNFAKGRYLPRNVPTAADGLEAPSKDNLSAVAIFSPWELEKILRHAPVDLLPCIVLGAFAGIRTIELTRIEWSAIHRIVSPKYPHGYIEISAAVAKQHRTAARRLIPISENLAAWLLPYQMRSGAISPHPVDNLLSRELTKLVEEINEAERAAGRRELRRPANGLRHSFGSYRLPVLDDVAALALEMNTSTAKIYANYRELVLPADVEAWWKIAPLEAGEIVRIPEKAAK